MTFEITTYAADNRPVSPVIIASGIKNLSEAIAHVEGLIASEPGAFFGPWIEEHGNRYRESEASGYYIETQRTKAEVILQQLGGQRFVAMTGARDFVDGGNSLTMRVAGRGLNRVKITLDANDTYTLEAFSVRGVNSKTVGKSEGVYVDMLQEVFTSLTGLYTKF